MNVFNAARESIVKYTDASLQQLGRAALFIRELRNDDDAFQKTCQLGFAIIKSMDLYNGGNNLPKLAVILINTVSMHNFLGFLKMPYSWTYPISTGSIDEFELAKLLAGHLRSLITVPVENTTATRPLTRSEAAKISEKYITQQLKEMSKDDRRYKNFGEFRNSLEAKIKKDYPQVSLDDLNLITIYGSKKLRSCLTEELQRLQGASYNADQANRFASNCLFNASKVKMYENTEDLRQGLFKYIKQEYPSANLKKLNELSAEDLGITKNYSVLKNSTLLNRIANAAFTILDIIIIPLYLQEWKLDPMPLVQSAIDKAGLSAKAKELGQYKVFQWAGEQNLGDIAWTFASIGFGYKFLEAVRQLHDDRLSTIQKTNAKWAAVSNFAELAVCITSLKQVSEPYVMTLTIIAKSIGILKFAFRPAGKFFDRAAAAA